MRLASTRFLSGSACGLAVLGASLAAGAEPASSGSGVTLTPHIGVVAESEYVEGPVHFSNGDVDYISIDPDTGLLIGVDLAYRFSGRVSGFLTLAYAAADAGYVEKDRLRPDVGLDTVRIQPGVRFDVASFGSSTLAFGAGLSLDFISVDGLVWHDRAMAPDSASIGLFGLAALDVGLTSRLTLRAQLDLELSHPFLGDLERQLALAEGERDASVDEDARTALILGLGLGIRF
jgi:hypothetical protein